MDHPALRVPVDDLPGAGPGIINRWEPAAGQRKAFEMRQRSGVPGCRVLGEVTLHECETPPQIRQIAAIVRSRGALIATRNVEDFTDAGIVIINPWEPGTQA